MCMVILYFVCVGSNSEMDNSGLGTQNVMEDKSVVWVDQETLDLVSAFIEKGGMNHAFIEVDPL